MKVLCLIAALWAAGVTLWLLVAPFYTDATGAGMTIAQANGFSALLWPLLLAALLIALAIVVARKRVGLTGWVLLGLSLIVIAFGCASFGLLYAPAWLLLVGACLVKTLKPREP